MIFHTEYLDSKEKLKGDESMKNKTSVLISRKFFGFVSLSENVQKINNINQENDYIVVENTEQIDPIKIVP